MAIECKRCGLLKSTVDNLVDNDEWKTCQKDKPHLFEEVLTPYERGLKDERISIVKSIINIIQNNGTTEEILSFVRDLETR